jgi:Uma2 family endonuclease
VKRPSYPTTLEGFLRWNQPEDGYKYEWNDGTIEKSAKMITPAQLYLVDNLSALLEKATPPAGGRMICEVQNRTTDVQVRIPDVAYYTKEEIRKAADKKYQPVTSFAIEIISDHDKINKVYGKLEEYFQAGVKVVWMIFPEFEKVHVFTSPEDVKICKGKTLCSAESVIPGFVISAADLFKKE